METLGVGIIGFGFIGKAHTYGYLNMPLYYDPVPVRTRLVGVATSREETARKAKEQGGFEFATTDWRELIARDDIQIINICSPNSQHAEQLLAAIAAGKHIYCDKPLVVTAEEARQIEAALREYQGTGQVTLQYRFYPPTLRAKQLIDEGFVGNVICFRASYLHSGSVDPNRPMGWKQLKSEGGGVLQDLGSHVLDLMDYLIGPVTSVMCDMRILYPERPTPSGEIVPVEADDHVVMLARLANGATGTIEATKIATGTEDELRFEIHGDRGALRFNLMDLNYLEAYDLREPDSPMGGQRGWRKLATVQRYEKPSGFFPSSKSGIGWVRGHMHCLYSFLRAIATGEPAEPSLQRGIQIQRMLAAAAHSATTHSWQELPR
ncbi:MAG TPA: Gfo/Idh/MocA family oxidoreductase [Armatimonadetes bacterium]|jgi:predicted dehydrogenase|nr:Gfo/Idh/MocA family oxidoreductase [Armatimonadota bacterium]